MWSLGLVTSIYRGFMSVTLIIKIFKGISNMANVFKVLGFVGALVTGTWLVLNGEVAQGVGILTAALSSSTFLQKQKVGE